MAQPVFEIYNEDGSIQINLSSRLTKYLGMVNITSTVPGSIQDERFKQGTPWFVFSGPNEQAQARATLPDVTISRVTGIMSWSPGIGTATPMIIVYGIYSNGVN